MEKSDMLDSALSRIIGELDDIEGHEAMEHSMEECPNPLECEMHRPTMEKPEEMDHEINPGEMEGKPKIASIEVHKMEGPEELSPEDAEMLKKLLK